MRPRSSPKRIPGISGVTHRPDRNSLSQLLRIRITASHHKLETVDLF